MSVCFPNLGLKISYLPKSFTVFGCEITLYGILIAVGMLLGFSFIALQARRQNESPNRFLTLSMLAAAVGVIGARLYYAVFSWSYFSGQSVRAILDIRSGGLAIYGGIFAGALFIWLFAGAFKVSAGKVADTASMGLLSAQIIGVWGNFFNRESFGAYTDSLFAMQLPLEAVNSGAVTDQMRDHLAEVEGVSCIQVHPLFLYESVWCLILLLFLLFSSRRKKFQGEIFLRYLAGYGLGKCVIEWLRTDKLYIPGTKIPVSLLVSAVLFVVCTIMAVTRRIMAKKRESIRRRRREEFYEAEEKRFRETDAPGNAGKAENAAGDTGDAAGNNANHPKKNAEASNNPESGSKAPLEIKAGGEKMEATEAAASDIPAPAETEPKD